MPMEKCKYCTARVRPRLMAIHLRKCPKKRNLDGIKQMKEDKKRNAKEEFQNKLRQAEQLEKEMVEKETALAKEREALGLPPAVRKTPQTKKEKQK